MLDPTSILRPRMTRSVAAPAEAVWDVLADGWLYASWVVGASRVRDVDETWPSPGARLHHSVGAWPALLSDSTEVELAEPTRRLVLTAHGGPQLGADRIATGLPPGRPQSGATRDDRAPYAHAAYVASDIAAGHLRLGNNQKALELLTGHHELLIPLLAAALSVRFDVYGGYVGSETVSTANWAAGWRSALAAGCSRAMA